MVADDAVLVPSRHCTCKSEAAHLLTAAASLQSKDALDVIEVVTFPFFSLWLQLAHDAMAWHGQSPVLFLGLLVSSKDKVAFWREMVNLSSTSLCSTTGAKGLTAAAGFWTVAAGAGDTMSKRGGCDCAELDIAEKMLCGSGCSMS